VARFDVRVAAAALDIDERWLDVTLTRFPVVGVTRGRRGVRRTLSLDAVVCAGIAYALVHHAGVGVESALDISHRLLRQPDGELRLGTGTLRLSMDLSDVRRDIQLRLARAVELSVDIPRGRPARRRRP
jgi:hypothetical protein